MGHDRSGSIVLQGAVDLRINWIGGFERKVFSRGKKKKLLEAIRNGFASKGGQAIRSCLGKRNRHDAEPFHTIHLLLSVLCQILAVGFHLVIKRPACRGASIGFEGKRKGIVRRRSRGIRDQEKSVWANRQTGFPAVLVKGHGIVNPLPFSPIG